MHLSAHSKLPPFSVLAVFGLLLLLCTSCRVDKYLGENEMLLKKNYFSTEMPDSSQAPKEVADALNGIEKYVVQTPNSHILGVRVGLRLYNLSSPKDSNFFSNYLRRKGQAPVIYNENATIRTAQQLQGLLVGKGCFLSTVSFDTTHLNQHDVAVQYHLHVTQRYRINGVTYNAESNDVVSQLNNYKSSSLLHVGDFYNQDLLAQERDLIASYLQNQGYFYASKENISFLIDSTFDAGSLSIAVWVRNPRTIADNGTTVEKPLRQYLIHNIYIFPNSNVQNAVANEQYDTLIYPYNFRGRQSNYHFIYNKKMNLSPQVIARSLFIFNDQMYHSRSIERSYNSLLNLRNFKYINFEFTEEPSTNDSIGLLNVRIRLINNIRQKISLSLEINNSSPSSTSLSSGNFGGEVVLAYQNKNLFGGAELLRVESSLLTELPKLILSRNHDETTTNISALEAGLSISLDLPKLLLPWSSMWQRSKPHTIINVGGNYQKREYFERLLVNTSYGYSWSPNRKTQQQILPVELTFARFFDIDPAFWQRIESIADNGRLKYQYSNHFIMDARYDQVYTTQQFNTRNNFSYLHFSVETAGNLLHGLSHAFDGTVDSSGVRVIFGVPYSQYVRFTGEFKRYIYYGKANTFVTRFLAGVGVPYGNSDRLQMPYEKSFFGGGPTTMRAWHLRRLGPGCYSSTDGNLLERTGDMTMVLNFENRFPLFGIFEGALFTDIGNVWLIYNSDEFPGGQFSLRNFIPSMAIGIGGGLRANISILTLRLDMGLPAYDPGYAQGSRWRINHWKDYTWNIRGLYFGPITFNIGIDYPF